MIDKPDCEKFINAQFPSLEVTQLCMAATICWHRGPMKNDKDFVAPYAACKEVFARWEDERKKQMDLQLLNDLEIINRALRK